MSYIRQQDQDERRAHARIHFPRWHSCWHLGDRQWRCVGEGTAAGRPGHGMITQCAVVVVTHGLLLTAVWPLTHLRSVQRAENGKLVPAGGRLFLFGDKNFRFAANEAHQKHGIILITPSLYYKPQNKRWKDISQLEEVRAEFLAAVRVATGALTTRLPVYWRQCSASCYSFHHVVLLVPISTPVSAAPQRMVCRKRYPTSTHATQCWPWTISPSVVQAGLR